jgi:hypothetical protein
MALELAWGGQTTVLDLSDGQVRVGGGPSDDIQVAGLPPRFLVLQVDGPRIRVTAQQPVRVGRAFCPARVPRLLLEGEALHLPGDAVLQRTVDPARRLSRRTMRTAFMARELLQGAFRLETSRAATLTCVAGPDQGAVFPLGLDRSSIGRAADADVRIRDRAASRRHLALVWEEARAVLEALAPSNAAYVNGRRLTTRMSLETGDVIELGQTLLRYDGPEPASEPLPPPPPESLVEPPPQLLPEPSGPLERALVALGAVLAVGGLAASAVLLAT